MEPYVVQPPADRTAEREAAARVFLIVLAYRFDDPGVPAAPAPAPAAQNAPGPGLGPQQQQQQQQAVTADARAGEAEGVWQGFALPQAARAAPASTAGASSVSSSSGPASSATFSSSSFAPPPPPPPPASMGAAQPGRNDEAASACEATAAAPELVPLPLPAEPTAPPPKRGFEEGPVPTWSARRPSHTKGVVLRARPWPRLQPLAVHRAGGVGAPKQALPLERIIASAA